MGQQGAAVRSGRNTQAIRDDDGGGGGGGGGVLGLKARHRWFNSMILIDRPIDRSTASDVKSDPSRDALRLSKEVPRKSLVAEMSAEHCHA